MRAAIAMVQPHQTHNVALWANCRLCREQAILAVRLTFLCNWTVFLAYAFFRSIDTSAAGENQRACAIPARFGELDLQQACRSPEMECGGDTNLRMW